MLKIKKKIVVFISFFLILGCYKSPVEERALKAKGAGDIVIGVAWPKTFTESQFTQGVTLAVEELNSQGGVLGSNIKTIVRDDDEGRKVAREFADNLDMVAVVGHGHSQSAISASLIYENAGLVFISPSATNPNLTHHKFKNMFRTIPSDLIIGEKLAHFAKTKKYKRIIILHSNNTYGHGLASIFKIKAIELGLNVIGKFSFNYREKNLRNFIRSYKDKLSGVEFDAVFLASHLNQGAHIIKYIRELGDNVPIFGGDGLYSKVLWKIAGNKAEGTVVAVAAHPNSTKYDTFSDSFSQRFGEVPDIWAAQGYDAIKLLAFAITKIGSFKPADIASYLHFIGKWEEGVTGGLAFDERGDVINKHESIAFKILHEGKFELIK